MLTRLLTRISMRLWDMFLKAGYSDREQGELVSADALAGRYRLCWSNLRYGLVASTSDLGQLYDL